MQPSTANTFNTAAKSPSIVDLSWNTAGWFNKKKSIWGVCDSLGNYFSQQTHNMFSNTWIRLSRSAVNVQFSHSSSSVDQLWPTFWMYYQKFGKISLLCSEYYPESYQNLSFFNHNHRCRSSKSFWVVAMVTLSAGSPFSKQFLYNFAM